MRRLALAAALLLPLTACVDPMLSADVAIGENGARVSPSLSVGADGGGRLSYTP